MTLADRKDPEKEVYDLNGDAADEAAPETAAAPAPVATPDAAALTEQVAKLQAEKEELRQTLIRRQADFENYRKRIERERHEEGRRTIARVIEGLLPVLDAFERALAAHEDPAYAEYRKGFELIYRQLWEALERQGLKRVEAAGKRFDPHYHQAVERVETREHEDGAIIELLQAGYVFRDKVLRPAMVRVAIHPPEKAPRKPTENSSGAPKLVN